MSDTRAARRTERKAAVEAARRAFGSRLAQLREQSGKSLADVGALIGLSGQGVSEWEQGKGEPNEADVMVLASLYGMTPMELRYGGQAPLGPQEMFNEGRRQMAEEVRAMLDATLADRRDASDFETADAGGLARAEKAAQELLQAAKQKRKRG